MKFVDLHCDTAGKLYYGKGEKLKKNNLSVDIEKLKKAQAMAQFFALFIAKDHCENLFNTCDEMLDNLLMELKENESEISLALTYNNVIKNSSSGKLSGIITIEEGEALMGDMKNLHYFYNKGVRLITLTWNFENSIGYPNFNEESINKGLKDFGIDLVREMNRLGVIIDVSHLSDGGFHDVAKYSEKPFVASHSNARYVKDHRRNLTDSMIKILGEKGGVMGINFCSSFLGDSSKATLDDMVSHIKHIKNVGGIDVIALGSDFDGIGNEVEIKDISEMNKLSFKLQKEGFSYEDIEKIFHKNALRVMKETLK